MWRIIRNMYSNTRSRVVVNGCRSGYFPMQQGVAQGDPLSPMLYAIFENGLLDALNSSEFGESLTAGVLAIMYADNLLGVALSLLRPCNSRSSLHAISTVVATGIR